MSDFGGGGYPRQMPGHGTIASTRAGSDDQLGFLDVARMVRRRLPLVVTLTVAALAVGLGYSFLASPVFRAEATVLVHTASSQGLFARPPGNATALNRTTSSELQYARSDVLAEIVGRPPDDFVVTVTGSDNGQTDTLTFVTVGPDQDRVAEFARAFADGYVTSREQQVEADVSSTLEGVETAIAELTEQRDALLEPLLPIEDALADAVDPDVISRLTTQRLTLLQSLDDEVSPLRGQLSLLNSERSQLVVLQRYLTTSDQTGARVLSTDAIGRQTAPLLVRDVALAGIGGLLLALVAAVIVDRAADQVRSSDDLKRIDPDLPVLATLPDVGNALSETVSWLGIGEQPSYRNGLDTLINSLRFARTNSVLQTIAVVAAGPDSGKTTVAASLALATANAGAATILVEGDVHRRDLSDRLGVTAELGLTEVLVGEAPLEDAVLTVPGEAIRFLAAGQLPLSAADTWRLAREQGLLDKLTGFAEIVIVDTPPLLAVSDGVVVASLADATIILARVGHTRRRDVADALDQLRRAGAEVMGVVLVQGEVSPYYGYERTSAS